MLYAAGIAAATGMLGTLIADYPQGHSRGKMVVLGGTLNSTSRMWEDQHNAEGVGLPDQRRRQALAAIDGLLG